MTAVLFADLVGYSRKPVASQFAAKDAFRDLLQRVLAPLSAESRIVLDTGDGAAIAFLSDPEHALYFALQLRADLAKGAAGTALRPEDLRLGLNLGPVKRMVDLNGHANLVGEGMNSAERVMSFAAPGETTASRSFSDAVSCLREGYAGLFAPLGSRTDKHGREHEVFRVVGTAAALAATRSSLDAGGERETGTAEDGSASREAAGAPPPGRSQAILAGVAGTLAAVTIVVAAVWVGRDAPSTAAPPKSFTPPAQPRPDADAATPPRVSVDVPAPAANAPGPVPGAAGSPAPAEAGAPAQDRAAAASVAEGPAAGSLGRTQRPAPRVKAVSIASPRCTSLLQRAALGEALDARDQEEMRTSCR